MCVPPRDGAPRRATAALGSRRLSIIDLAGGHQPIANEDGSIEVICLPSDFAQVDAALKKAGLKPEIAEIAMKPTLENALAGDDAVKMRKLLDALEGLDDVQEVYTTAALDEA